MDKDSSKSIIQRDDVAFNHAVNLVLKQDEVVHNWAGRYIVIQGGLAAAEFGILNAQQVHFPIIIFGSAILIIPGLGIIFAIILTDIIRREIQWQRFYLQAARLAEGSNRKIYIEEIKPYDPKKPGVMEKKFIILRRILIAIWGAVVTALVYSLIWRLL